MHNRVELITLYPFPFVTRLADSISVILDQQHQYLGLATSFPLGTAAHNITAMSREAVKTTNAPTPPPGLSQAIKYNGMVYCSGNIGSDTEGKVISGGVKEETVRTHYRPLDL